MSGTFILNNFIVTLLLISTLETGVKCEKILIYVGGISSYSHRAGLEPLALKLVEKGHTVTFFGPIATKRTNPKAGLTDFCPPELQETHSAFIVQYGIIGLQGRIQEKYFIGSAANGTAVYDIAIHMCELTFKSKEFQSWVERSSFDLVIVDKTSLSECAFALAYKFGAKTMSYMGAGTPLSWNSEYFGLPSESYWIPSIYVNYQTEEMGMLDRLWSEALSLRGYFNHRDYFLPKLDEMTRDVLGIPDAPKLLDLIRAEGVMLVNMHYSDSYARSFPPVIVPVGGLHLQESTESLSQDLQDFIQAGENGFIYISFGSIITISSMPQSLLQVFFDALGTLPLRFLWKWEGQLPENIPPNVKLLPWFPQAAVLAHPKIRGFITQGGQVSVQEAIFHSVPMVVFPVNGDQDLNAKRIRNAGNGIEMEFCGLTVQELQDAINELLHNKTFSLAAQELSVASRDRPMHPLDTAVWWTEFVLRNNAGVFKRLKPSSMYQSWVTRRSLDLISVIFAVLLAIGIFVFFITLKVYFWFKSSPKRALIASRGRRKAKSTKST